MNMNLSETSRPSFALTPFQNRLLVPPLFNALIGISARHNLVELSKNTVLYRPDSTMDYAYFPINSLIAKLYELENGDSSEICMVGNEGMIGVSMVLGAESTPNLAVVQKAGFAYRVGKSELMTAMDKNSELRTVLLRYAQSRMTQITRVAVCNRYHGTDQRLSLLLLQTLDRLEGNNVALTHEEIAKMLGVRRESITESTGKLKRLGAISCSRGNVVLRDKAKLMSLCCECYDAAKMHENRVFPMSSGLANKKPR